jgi:hypothetical protein
MTLHPPRFHGLQDSRGGPDPSFQEFLPFLITLVSFMAAVTVVNLMPVEVTGVKLRKSGVKLRKGRLHVVRRPGEAMSVEYPSSPYIGPE